MVANDNQPSRYTVRRYSGKPHICVPAVCWRVYDADRAVSIGFDTKIQAERCKAGLIAADERFGVRSA